MSHAQVQRKTLYFGGRSLSGAVTAMGVPGPAIVGGYAIHPDDVAAALAAGYVDQPAASHYQRIDIPAQGNGVGPVNAICIAPDSAISCCDIAIMGRDGELERHRISAGNPLLGCLGDSDFAYVSIPAAIPLVPSDGVTVAWDASSFPTIDGSVDPKALIYSFPLRLEFWRGAVSPQRAMHRAPLVAHALFKNDTTLDKSMIVCVDGRRRIDVQVHTTSSDVNLTGQQWEPSLRAPLTPSHGLGDIPMTEDLEFDGATTQTIPFGNLRVFSFYGNPMTLMFLNLEATAATGFSQLRVFAYDD